jgi:hypothetical protein
MCHKEFFFLKKVLLYLSLLHNDNASLNLGGNKRGVTIVYIRCCYCMGVWGCSFFNKFQKCGEEGKHLYRYWPLHSKILNFGASEDPGVNIS